MLYIYMLGYDVDFGHMEAVSLISAPKYPEKQVFYSRPLTFLNDLLANIILCLHWHWITLQYVIKEIEGKNCQFNGK